MSERVDVEADIVEKKGAPEVSTAAMGATACLSCVGCPLMQQCALPQAVEARARAAKRELDGAEEEYVAEIDYAAALLDEDGPAVVWAQAAISADPETAPSERESPTSPTAEHDEGEAAEHREVPPPSWTMSMNKLWEMPVAVPEPELESVFDPDSATEPELALDPSLAPEAVPDPVPSLNPDPVSELVVEQELDTAPEIRAEPVLSDGIDVAPAVVCQEVRVAADQVETPVVSVSQPCIEPSVQMSTEQPTIETHREPTAEGSVEQAVEINTDQIPEVNAAPNTQTIEHHPATAETAKCGIPCQDPVVLWGATTYEEPVLSQPERIDRAIMTVWDERATIISRSADFTVEVAPDREELAIESEYPPPSAPLMEASTRAEGMRVDAKHSIVDKEVRVSPSEMLLSVASDEEIVCDEVLLSPAGVEMEEVDSRLGSEPCREALTNVVYNTTKRDDDTTLTGRDSDHAESEAPNSGYGASWLAALLGVVAVFTVVRRRSGAVY